MTTNYFNKISNAMRLWAIPVITGLLLILSGLGIALVLDLKALAKVISGFMFLSGFLGIIYVYVNNKRLDGRGFYLTLAGLDFVLAILLLTTSDIKITTISMILSFWILFHGLGKIIYSIDVQKLGIKNWDVDLITGILFVGYGVVSIFLMSLSPAFILLATAIVLSLGGIFQICLALVRQVKYKNYLSETETAQVETI